MGALSTDLHSMAMSRWGWCVLVSAALLHALIVVPNAWLLRTFTLDLGAYTHAAWQYAHGHLADTAVFQREPVPMLADHFDLHLMLWAPLTWLFGSWTLLLVQWAAVIVGALGLHRLALAMDAPPRLAVVLMAHLLFFFSVFAAMSFDYHSNVVSAMALPWYLLALLRGRSRLAWLLLFFMLAGKETMGIWLACTLGALVTYPSWSRTARRHLLVHAATAAAWSLLVLFRVMPALSPDGRYAHFDYHLLGDRPAEAIATIVHHPMRVLGPLVSDTTGVANGTAIKLEFLVFLLVSGGWVLLLEWRLLPAALPVLAMKLLHDDPVKWGVGFHYAVELAPLVPLALLLHWRKRLERRWVFWVGLGSLALTVACSIHLMDHTIGYQAHERIRIYQPQHWVKDYDVAAVRRRSARVGPSLAVSAQDPFVPLLACRERIYQFPLGLDQAEVVLLGPQEVTYPLDGAHYAQLVDSLLRDPHWRVTERTASFIRLDRNKAL